jgi:hypothetical protein
VVFRGLRAALRGPGRVATFVANRRLPAKERCSWRAFLRVVAQASGLRRSEGASGLSKTVRCRPEPATRRVAGTWQAGGSPYCGGSACRWWPAGAAGSVDTLGWAGKTPAPLWSAGPRGPHAFLNGGPSAAGPRSPVLRHRASKTGRTNTLPSPAWLGVAYGHAAPGALGWFAGRSITR